MRIGRSFATNACGRHCSPNSAATASTRARACTQSPVALTYADSMPALLSARITAALAAGLARRTAAASSRVKNWRNRGEKGSEISRTAALSAAAPWSLRSANERSTVSDAAAGRSTSWRQ
eukprot:Amastigsp_a843135_19.p3 type:complete len:121 gc:universal Amastigsp_a843135_19:496-134(-)